MGWAVESLWLHNHQSQPLLTNVFELRFTNSYLRRCLSADYMRKSLGAYTWIHNVLWIEREGVLVIDASAVHPFHFLSGNGGGMTNWAPNRPGGPLDHVDFWIWSDKKMAARMRECFSLPH